jgi:hypothetical protein
VNRLRQWHRPGLVCIGDAAHAMSPVRGVGINLAIQDAVAAAKMLAGPLREGAVSPRDLAKIQRRRAFPTRLTQRVQALIQKRLPCRLRNRVTAVGIRPEHVRTPDVSLAQAGPATHNPKCERSDAGLTGVNSSFIFNAAGNTNAKIGALTGERGPRVVTLEMRAAF